MWAREKEEYFKAGQFTFEIIDTFVYLETEINKKKYIMKENQREKKSLRMVQLLCQQSTNYLLYLPHSLGQFYLKMTANNQVEQLKQKKKK